MSEERCPRCGAELRERTEYGPGLFFEQWDCRAYRWSMEGRVREGMGCLRRQIARLRRERDVLAAAIRLRHEFEARRDWSVPDEAWPGAAYYGTMAASDDAWRRALRLLEEGVLEDEQAGANGE